jgi:hypothetical protein
VHHNFCSKYFQPVGVITKVKELCLERINLVKEEGLVII